MSKPMADTGATKLVIGWLEPGSSKKDATEYARGYATKFFDSVASSWYNLIPFMGGWIYEIQEGGSGHSYLPAVVRALVVDDQRAWIRVGNRVLSPVMQDGRPTFTLISPQSSPAYMEHSESRLEPKGVMKRIINRGTGILVAGAVVAVTGFMFLSGSGVFSLLSREFTPSERIVNINLLPHQQWKRVNTVPTNLYIQKLEMPRGSEDWIPTTAQVQSKAVDPEPIPEEIFDDNSDVMNDISEDYSVEGAVENNVAVDVPLESVNIENETMPGSPDIDSNIVSGE